MRPEIPHRLIDGREPATSEQLFAHIAALGIPTRTYQHRAVYTVDEAKAHRGNIPGVHLKNLFLRDKTKHMWLLTCLEDRSIDLKGLAVMIGSGRLSLGSPQRLMEYLGIEPGAVSPFAVLNDSRREVTALLDAGLGPEDLLNCHPLDNSMTTSIRTSDLVVFLESTGHQPQRIVLGG